MIPFRTSFRIFLIFLPCALVTACYFHADKDLFENEKYDRSQISFGLVRAVVLSPRCIPCHSARDDIDFSNYRDVVDWLPEIGDAILQRKMPPNRILTSTQFNLLTEWIEMGAPEFPVTPEPSPSTEPSPTPEPDPEPSPEPHLDPVFHEIKKRVIEARCLSCHKPDGDAEDVPIATLADLLKGKKPLVVPEKPEESPLYRAITRKDKKRMPPPKSGPRLSKDMIEAIFQWIATGAKDN